MSSESSRTGSKWRVAVLGLVVVAASVVLFVIRFEFPVEHGTAFDLRIDSPSGSFVTRGFAPRREFGAMTPVAAARVSRESRLLERLSSVDRLREIRVAIEGSTTRDLATDSSIPASDGFGLPVLVSPTLHGEFVFVEIGDGCRLDGAASSFESATMLAADASTRERLTLWEALRAPNGTATLPILLREWLQRLGWLGPMLFVVLYLVATLLALPGAVLTIAGGLAFGMWKGLLVVTIGANLGASAAFLFARFVARSAIEKRLPPRLQALDRDLEANGLRTILFVRLVPLFPFNVINYLCGVSRLRYRDFVVGSLIGMVPATFLWIFTAISATSLSPTNPVTWLPLASFSLILLAPRLYRWWTGRRSAARGGAVASVP
ncbi:MAG: TVP38/TMEM64 family protein [Planctomycetes bacterium]|nr:TVP38/TMEM64 family protein [Planctomycetota bacterium]